MFSLFKTDRLSPEWTFSAGSIIWRMVLAEPGLLVGECRDPQSKSTSFFGLEILTGKVLWNDLCLHDSWWVGIEAVQKNVVLFHGFTKPDMPEHKGIQAFDTFTGKRLWQNDDVSFWFGFEDRIVAYRDLFEKRVGYEFDLQSGELLKSHDTSLAGLHELRQRVAEAQVVPDVILPEIYVEEEAGKELGAFVTRETKGIERVGAIEYVRQEGFLVFNYHVQSRGRAGEPSSLENHLVVYLLPEKKRIFTEIIGRNLSSYVPDSFFIKRPLVLFVKDQRVLTALRLWKS
jgi:hypothetical protein